MNKPNEVVFLLPVYNEAPAIADLLDAIRTCMTEIEQTYRIVAVDDGSTDSTPQILQEKSQCCPLQIITHARNRGLPETLRDGFATILDTTSTNDCIVCMDADNTHTPDHVTAMLTLIDSGADVVIASRYQPGASQTGIAWQRRVYSLGVRFLASFFSPIQGVRDHGCGFRCFRASVLKRAWEVYGDNLITLDQYGFVCTTEYLVKFALLNNVSFAEIPLQLHYEHKTAPSKMRVWATMQGYGRLFYRYRFTWRIP